MCESALAAGVLDEDAAHGLGRRGKEVAPAIPVLNATFADQAQIRLMDEGRGLECLPPRFVGQPVRRQPAPLLVDKRQELRRGLRVPGLDSIQHNSSV
jgi:hypothetical protein